jgi:hypothetical protein
MKFETLNAAPWNDFWQLHGMLLEIPDYVAAMHMLTLILPCSQVPLTLDLDLARKLDTGFKSAP